MAQLHQVNRMEIEAGRLAQLRSVTRAVRDYGRMLVVDHTRADGKLRALAQRSHVDLEMSALPADLRERPAVAR